MQQGLPLNHTFSKIKNQRFLTLFSHHTKGSISFQMTQRIPHLSSFACVYPHSTSPRQHPNWKSRAILQWHSRNEIIQIICNSPIEHSCTQFSQITQNFENLIKHLFLSSSCTAASSSLSRNRSPRFLRLILIFITYFIQLPMHLLSNNSTLQRIIPLSSTPSKNLIFNFHRP